MENLVEKYKTGMLTPEELEQLRAEIANMSDEQFARTLVGECSDDLFDECLNDAGEAPTDATIARMKAAIDIVIDTELNPISTVKAIEEYDEESAPLPLRRKKFANFMLKAAAVLLPIFIASTIFLFISGRETSPRVVADTTITTGIGERSTVTLPDGSVVTLHNLSELTFAQNLGEKDRNVNFSGEAYFSIAKNKTMPFIINAGDMTVKVLGTEFSLMARESSDCSELMLDRGEVVLTSTKNKSHVLLHSGEMATFNKLAGTFDVEQMPEGAKLAWRFTGIKFDNVAPDSLINSVEHIYNIKLNRHITRAINSNFTGTLPNDDIIATLEILSYIYDFPLAYTQRNRLSASN